MENQSKKILLIVFMLLVALSELLASHGGGDNGPSTPDPDHSLPFIDKFRNIAAVSKIKGDISNRIYGTSFGLKPAAENSIETTGQDAYIFSTYIQNSNFDSLFPTWAFEQLHYFCFDNAFEDANLESLPSCGRNAYTQADLASMGDYFSQEEAKKDIMVGQVFGHLRFY